MRKENVGKPITTHEHLQRMVKNKKWIVLEIVLGKHSTFKSYVAAAFVNRRYIEVCEYLKKGWIFEYKKNKL